LHKNVRSSLYKYSVFPTRWVGQIEEFLQSEVIAEQHVPMANAIRSVDLRGEVAWLQNYLTSVRSPVVFCHNDLQEGNILLTKTPSGQNSVSISAGI